MFFESVLAVLLLVLALVPLVTFARMDWLQALGMAALALAIGSWLWRALYAPPSIVEQEAAVHSPEATPSDGYASSETCQACHPAQYETWHASYHRAMTQAARPENALATFDGKELQMGDKKLRLLTRRNRLWVEVSDPEARGSDEGSTSGVVPVTLMTGSHHMQFYWAPTGKGRELWLLPIGFLVEDQRWIPRQAKFLLPPADHWVLEKGRWNNTCIACHTTRGEPGEVAEQIDSHVTELGIACEACHGPAADHVRANQNPLRRYEHHLAGGADGTIVQPGRLSAKLASQVCGQCHGIHEFRDPHGGQEWLREGFAYRPGDDLEKTRIPFQVSQVSYKPQLEQRVESDPNFVGDRFWSDGMVRVSGREYNGLIESPCYRGGEFSCLSCHVMHKRPEDARPTKDWADDQLKPRAETDQACLECHASIGENIEGHTHHAAASDGSRCYNCHMPYTTYGLLKAIRSHQVSSPSVATTLQTGRPNACNQCHLDKTLSWAAGYLEQWYGTPQPTMSEDERRVAASVLWALEGDAGQRALAAWSMGWSSATSAAGQEWVVPYLAQLLVDPYDAVRFIAGRSLRRLKGFQDFEYDYVGLPEGREAARVRALEIWRSGSKTAGRDAVLIDGEGRIDQEAFDRLLQSRNDRRVWLKE